MFNNAFYLYFVLYCALLQPASNKINLKQFDIVHLYIVASRLFLRMIFAAIWFCNVTSFFVPVHACHQWPCIFTLET